MRGRAPAKSALGARDIVRVGGRGLRARKLRSTLTGLGIAIGIAAMVAVLGISDSSRASLLAALDRIGSNLLTITAGQTFLGETRPLPEDATRMVARVQDVEQSSGVEATAATVRRTDHIPETETGGISVQAADLNLLETLSGTVRAGHFLDRATERGQAVVLGAVAARRLGIADLHAPVLVRIGDSWWSVVGILDELPLAPEIDRSALVGHPAAATWLDAQDSPSTIYVRVVESHINKVRAVLPSAAFPENRDAVRVSRPSDVIEARAAAATAFTGLFLGLGAVSLIVGGLGIANVMLMAVLERRGEIGVRRALGATRGQIAAQFLTEAVLLAGGGGAAGAILGMAAAVAYARSQDWIIALPVAGLAAAIAVAAMVGAGAGLYPALRAAAVSPTEALRA